MIRILPWALAVLVFPAVAPSEVIDFETLPVGGDTVDQQQISTEYASLGVTFTLLDRNTGLPVGFPRIAKAGPPRTAFEGCFDDDTPMPHVDLGTSFLTDGVSLGIQGDLRVEYATPVAQASGVILDIDCRVAGGPPCEQWTITAYDSTGGELQNTVLDGPPGARQTHCDNPDAGPGDSEAFGWAIDVGTPEIRSIILRYTGSAGNVGLAFDAFSISSLPGPPSVTVSASVDTVCFGETVTLTATVSGGFPPYAFQWEQETAPGSWASLGTGATQDVLPTTDSTYRVIVTDSAMEQATSPLRSIAVDRYGPLCATSLLVSNHNDHNIVRYSLRGQIPSILVPSGSGGLSYPSELICEDGHLYVSDQGSDQIVRFDGATGDFLEIFVAANSGGLDTPVGLDFGPDGNLYVASFATHSVLRYAGTDGAFLGVFVPTGSGLNGPTDLLFGPDDNLYVCSYYGDKVLRFDGTTGAPLGDFVTAGSGGLDRPRGATFGPDGDLYVAEEVNDSVRRFDGTTGGFVEVFVTGGSGGLDRANDVAFAPDGRLYVPSFTNSLVLAYDDNTGAPEGALPDGVLNGPAWLEVGCVPYATDVPVMDARAFELVVEPNAPNPFGPRTTVAFSLPARGHVRVTVLDVAGRLVDTLLDTTIPSGRHTVQWSGRDSEGRAVPSGVYFLRVQSGGVQKCAKMVLLR